MKKMLVLLLLSATAALAADTPREIFPADFKAQPCAPANACESFTQVSYASAASVFLLRSADVKWEEAHRRELLAMIQPYCSKRATCLATPGNDWMFCNDVFAQELRAACETPYPQSKNQHDSEQCRLFVEVYALGVDQRGSADWKAAQKCTTEANAANTTAPLRHMEWWTVPAAVPAGYKGTIRVYAIDTETHVPVQASIAYEGQILYSKDAPSGRLQTYYSIPVPEKFVRVSNASGHSDVLPPTMTLSASGYETITTRAPMTFSGVRVSVRPSLDKLPRGKRATTTVSTVDDKSGEPVEMQVMLGDQLVGMSNQPIEVKLPKSRKRPELWVTSPFDTYSDVVVVPAGK